MQLTSFGYIVRHRRIDLDMTLKQMAEALGVSNAFLSAVELGKRPVPDAWGEAVPAILKMTDDETLKLRSAILTQKAKRSMHQLGDPSLEAVVEALFANRAGLDDSKIQELIELIRKMARGQQQREVA
jgi:transcriptional regulator with XRE-family HTH domain